MTAESERSVLTGEPFRSEYRVVHPNGHTVWIREDAVLIADELGQLLHWLGLMLDVTELIRTQAELHEATSKYGALVEQIPAIVYVDVEDENMSTKYVSPQIEQILGYSPQEYIEDPQLWEHILHPDDRDEAMATYLRGRESGGPFVFEYRLVARNGRTVWFRDSAIVLTDAHGRAEYIQGVMLDITDGKLAEERIAFLAYHDRLTGLPNRTMFDELLGLALVRAKRHNLGVVVVTVDLDDFKLVNDSLGHEAGDALLVRFAQRLSDATRETDLVARPGGDEFLLLLADLDQTPVVPGSHESVSVAAESVALRVQEALRTPFKIGETELYITASLGISLFPEDADDAATLLKNAETAMFRSKRSGPGGYVLHAKDDADSIVRLSLSTRLRRAVEQERWTLHYQPLINPDHTLGILHELHARGVKLAIDDFGTGYSSLARLRCMPVDVLKIDQSFVRELDRDDQNASMVSAMVALASNLGMTSFAEGIETEAEWRALVVRGCERGQGYFFSRPVPAGEIVAIHRRAGLRMGGGERGGMISAGAAAADRSASPSPPR